jgi:energy-coupling factor transporter ATP-binding protein EcfA2
MTSFSTRPDQPRWLRDLVRFLPLKSQFVLSGNVRDLQVTEIAPNVLAPQSLIDNLAAALFKGGYSRILVYAPITGFTSVSPSVDAAPHADQTLSLLGLTGTDGRAPAGIEALSATMDRIVSWSGPPVALIVDFASRLISRPNDLPAAEHQLFTRAMMLSHQSRARPTGQPPRPYFNSVVWVVEREGDLPDWFLVNNPRVRHIPITKPDNLARRAIASALLRPLVTQGSAPEQVKKAEDAFVDGTDGMLLLDMNAIAILAHVEGVQLERIADAVRRYKVGVTEDPWLKIDSDKIRAGEAFVRRRVKGQAPAVTHMLDIVKRAMTGVGGARRGNRPRGVAFLAGPTGVGKTELAKTITSLLFGDEGAYIRFDMSEFSAEHSDQRLIGAPPSYIGYDAGGELTNAIREKPFSVVLFDEIEKAHPRVLDKFLQILDDGVLTSGRGDRVYFSEAMIVFTSNIGIYKIGDQGERVLNVSLDEPYQTVRDKVHAEITRHFRFVLNRPEILNRIGENVIVFDFIRPDIAGEIFEEMIQSILEDMQTQQQIAIGFSGVARNNLRTLCLQDLANGGRGIRNKVEAHLLNPLARALFDEGAKPGCAYQVNVLDVDGLSLVEV